MEVAASEQEASIPTRVRPLFCPNSQARVHVAPPEVFFKCLDHIVEPAFSIMARTEEKDPIRFQEAAGEIPAVSIPKYHIGLRACLRTQVEAGWTAVRWRARRRVMTVIMAQ